MSLVAGGRVELPKLDTQQTANIHMSSDNFNINTSHNLMILNELSNKLDNVTADCLQTLSWAVSALADVDPDASKLVVKMCTKVRVRSLQVWTLFLNDPNAFSLF